MFRNKLANNSKMFGRFTQLLAVPLLLFGLVGQRAGAQVQCGCNTTSCGVSFATLGGTPITPGASVAGGTVIRATVQIAPQAVCAPPNQALVPCEFHHGSLVLTHPDGFVEVLTADLATTTGSGAPLTFVSTHPVTLTASGFALWTMTYGNPANPSPDALDGSWITPSGDQLGASATCAQGLQVFNPRLCITKNCVNPCTPYGQPIQIAGTVSNCGDEPLVNVNVVDNPPAVLSFTLNGNPVTAPFALAPGQTVSFTGQYSPANAGGTSLCGPFTDTVTATGTGAITSTPVSASTNATCHVQTSPSISLTKDCQPRTVTNGGSYRETFVVCNTGNVPLANVVINDTKVGAIPIGTLQPGQCVTNVQGPFTVNSPDCLPLTDRATATGNKICPADATCPAPATVSSAEVTCTVTVLCEPRICLTKQVACSPPSGVCDGSLPYAETATGVANSADPAFCYRITVLNCGPITLTNVTVSDPDLGGILAGFPPSLAPGQSATAYFKKTWGVGTHVNTATTSGIGAPGGVRVTTNDTATAIVLNINIVCDLTLGSSFDMDNSPTDNHVTLPTGSVDTPITFTLTLRNTGTSPLTVTAINGLPGLVDCITGNPIVVPLPINIPASGTFTISGCVNVSCPGTNFTVSAHAEADDQGGTLCVYDSQGNRIADDTTPCSASVTCVQAVTCRVTGGGQLIPGFVDQSCIEVATTIFPFTSPNGLTIKKITHGGQLGAPFSHMDCGEILGNPCIRGQWSHTRHYEGTANPRDVFDMNFHSQTPKGQYDSLTCACLGCCDPATGAFIPPSLGPLIKKFQLCNPDDHKVCGPQPRPSPANAIIWSGIGKVTPVDDVRGSRAAQAEWVVFRVYIEDRSEPGGGHPGGAVEPADIYCFQAWKTGIKVSKKPDFSTIATAFRQALGEANCDFLEALEGGVMPIGTLPSPTVGGVTADIQDCGPMHDGNHQIHPSTGATCTE